MNTPRTAEQRIALAIETGVQVHYNLKAARNSRGRFDAYTFQLNDEAAPTTVMVPPNAEHAATLQKICIL